MRRFKITNKFTDLDGEEKERSSFDDIQTLKYRVFFRLKEIMGKEEFEKYIPPTVADYNNGRYKNALNGLLEVVKKYPSLEVELEPHINICRRVLSIEKSGEDLVYEEKNSSWVRRNPLLQILLIPFGVIPLPLKLRCKYCGHYTDFVRPDEGVAYFETNNCEICGRGYPVPDFAWDGIDGQAYIYYRHSVTENEFYDEFEAKYNPSPGRDYYLAK